MDEVFLINKLRASFLINSKEISNIRVISPYKIEENGGHGQRYTELSTLYVDDARGKDYLKIIKSPPINEDYFLVLADDFTTKKTKGKDNDHMRQLSLDIYKNHSSSNDYSKNYEKNLEKGNININLASKIRPAASHSDVEEGELIDLETEDNLISKSNSNNNPSHNLASNIKQKVSRRISSASSIANNELHSINSKLSKRNSMLRLSKISNFFSKTPKIHNHNASDNMSIFTNDDMISNRTSSRLFQTRSKSASFNSRDSESLSSSRNESSAKKSSDIIRRGVSSLYRKKSIADVTADTISSKKKNYFNNKFFRSKSDNFLNNEKRNEMTSNSSNMVLENMMYTDQLFRDGEIPENFEDNDDDDDDDDDDDVDNEYNANHQKESHNVSNDSFSLNPSNGSDNETIGSSKLKIYNKVNSFTRDMTKKNLKGSSISLNNNESNSAHEDHIFNFKKIGKKLLPSNNNNSDIVVEKSTSTNSNNRSNSVILNTSYRDSHDSKALVKTKSNDNTKNSPPSLKAKLTKNNNKQAPYPDLMKIGSFMEDNDDLKNILNFDYAAPSYQEINEVDMANSNIANSSGLDMKNRNTENENSSTNGQITGINERYYGDLASSFGESLIDSDFDFEKDHIENSIPSDSDFIENKLDNKINPQNNVKSSGAVKNEACLVKEDLFKKIDFTEQNIDPYPSKLTPLFHGSKNDKNVQDNYEGILAKRNEGMELICYLEGNPKSIELYVKKDMNITNFQLLQLILYKFDKISDIDCYILRIVDEDGLPFEGDFGILSREGIVERNLMMEELVACKTDDQQIIQKHKLQRENLIQSVNELKGDENLTNFSGYTQKKIINLNVYGKSNTVPVNIAGLDTVGEIVSRYCLQRDLDPISYYLKFKDDHYYLDKDTPLKDVFTYSEEPLQIIKIKESRLMNFTKLQALSKENESEENYPQEDVNSTIAPFTLKNDGNFLPVEKTSKQSHTTSSNTQKATDTQPTTQRDRNNFNSLFSKTFDNRNTNNGMNGLPLNLTEVYYKYTVFRRHHQKVSLLNNKQLKTLAIDGDFIYLVDNNSAPGMLSNGHDGEPNNRKHWFDQQYHQNQHNGNNFYYNEQGRTKTFHISQLIKIDKSSKNKLHFKIKFTRVHGPKSYYFEALTTEEREEIVYKLTTLKNIYNSNK